MQDGNQSSAQRGSYRMPHKIIIALCTSFGAVRLTCEETGRCDKLDCQLVCLCKVCCEIRLHTRGVQPNIRYYLVGGLPVECCAHLVSQLTITLLISVAGVSIKIGGVRRPLLQLAQKVPLVHGPFMALRCQSGSRGAKKSEASKITS